MIYFIIIVIIAYGILNIPFANQIASPFLAVVFIYTAVMLHDMYDEQKQIKRELSEIKEMLSSAEFQKDKPCIENEENAAEGNSIEAESDSDSLK